MVDTLSPDELAAIRADVARWDDICEMPLYTFLDAHGAEQINQLKDRFRKAIPGLLATIEAQEEELSSLREQLEQSEERASWMEWRATEYGSGA